MQREAPDLAASITARSLFRQLLLIYVVWATVAVAANVTLLALGLEFTPQQVQFTFSIVAPIVAVVVVAVDVTVIRRQYRPIARFLDALEGGRPTAELAYPALTQTLNFPFLTGARIMGIHGPVALLTATTVVLLGNRLSSIEVPLLYLVITWATFFVTVAGHAIFEYFFVQRAMRPVIPVIRPHCTASDAQVQEGVTQVGIRRRLLFLSVFVTFIPLLVLGFTVLLKVDLLLTGLGMRDAGPRLTPLALWVILFVAIATATTVAMSTLMAADIAALTDSMVRAMRRVQGGQIDTRLTVVSADEFADLYQGFNHMTGGLQERERLRDAFGRYVAPEIAEQVVREGVSLGGDMVEASILFADIRNFTGLSERLTPAAVVDLLNHYFAAIDPAIRGEGGWINKFGGDSLLAVFGAPVPHPDHAARAVRAAVAMRAALARFNDAQAAAGRPTIGIGIGVHSGAFIAGSVGSPDRLEYTVIGDAVNVAARIQALNKTFHTDILISEDAYGACLLDISVRALPPTPVQGKTEPVHVYAVE